jgi:hypothetical protein
VAHRVKGKTRVPFILYFIDLVLMLYSTFIIIVISSILLIVYRSFIIFILLFIILCHFLSLFNIFYSNILYLFHSYFSY